MIDKKDLDENIAELEGARNHSPQMCARLANLYTIRKELFGDSEQVERVNKGYSFASAPATISEPVMLGDYGDSDFLLVIQGKAPELAWKVMDKLMDTLRVVNPKVYDSVMQEMKRI